ncbi:phage tail protein [Paraburkholderia atlantica]|uniref:phage tail protein n=1 Tax=Paraburkholderia atlantica TaxID=2654982 RepID=UPI000363500C|nr:phage tail protein [Paraburkholderia atlantica]
MADTFTWSPTVAGTSGTDTASVRAGKFGDGYEQRSADGINNIVASFDLQFIGDASKISAIRAFLKERAGATSFYWTPPLEASPLLFYCATWSRPAKDGDVYTMTATFTQTFAP